MEKSKIFLVTGVTSGFDTFAPGLPRTFSAGLQAKW